MWLAILFALTKADVCDAGLNDKVDSINEDCNYAGLCYQGNCYCCDTTAKSGDYCQGNVPGTWVGKKCEQATVYTQVTWGYLFETDSITCGNNGAASPNLLSQTIAVLSDYDGEIIYLECENCSAGSPCTFFSQPPVADSGVFLKFGTDLNTYYDLDCSQGDLPDTVRQCGDNWDNGANAYMEMMEVLDQENSYAQFITDLRTLLTSSGDNGLSSLASELSRVWHAEVELLSLTVQTTRLPTPAPTPEPTSSPTIQPIEIGTGDDKNCSDYSNSIKDLHYLGVGSSCRGNIDESWTGGRTCESPYIICLPGENTPTNDMNGNPYKPNTYRYNVSDCLMECSYDQRCLGIEFVADAGSSKGDCNLIDDIQVAVEDEGSYEYHESHVNLDSSITGGDALCWAKTNYCNPYFEAENLNDAMLNCYCPNNRKGFYTKKVQRTVDNTRYCDDDAAVDQRIKKAQANRMFHLCENWCLFETLNPEKESWYWDPWVKCWRETYSGTGEHRSYCDRVIRNPDSIELKFVNYRSDNFFSCGASKHPTEAPVSDPSTWMLADAQKSCDDACSSQGKMCAEDNTAVVFGSETDLINAFAEGGHTCDIADVNMSNENYEGWALPGLKSNGECVNRLPTISHLESLDTDCSRKLGGSWRRLCACY